jgi:transposase
MDIEGSSNDCGMAGKDDPTLGRTIIPAAPRTTIIARMSARRRWTAEEKRAIVEASYEPGARVQEVAHCFEVSPAQIYSWRRQVADGTIERSRSGVAPTFARVELADQGVPALPYAGGSGAIEIRLSDGTAIVVGSDVSQQALIRVLAALGR